MRTLSIVLFASVAWLLPAAPSAHAQSSGLDVGRDCKTLLTCNFSKRGAVRGCLSSYSCRVCRTVPAPCQVKGGERRCHELRCGWG